MHNICGGSLESWKYHGNFIKYLPWEGKMLPIESMPFLGASSIIKQWFGSCQYNKLLSASLSICSLSLLLTFSSRQIDRLPETAVTLYHFPPISPRSKLCFKNWSQVEQEATQKYIRHTILYSPASQNSFKQNAFKQMLICELSLMVV